MFTDGGLIEPDESQPIRVVVNLGEFIVGMAAAKRVTDEL